MVAPENHGAEGMTTIGFIGLGVMGEPMCRNLARKGGVPVVAFDLRREPLERVAAHGVRAAPSATAVVEASDIVLLSLPGEPQVRALCLGPDGIVRHTRRGQLIADTSTCPVALARELDTAFAAQGADFADAPIARTRQAAEQGTLSIMVGATPAVFERLQPVLTHMGSEVTHCGPVGCGQLVKLMNNMVIAETVVALSEAITIARRAGMDDKLLFDAMAKGSSDSFALRNHGLKAVLPGDFPENAFSARYMLKDLSYALSLAAETGVDAAGARHAAALMEAAIERGDGDRYWPAIVRVIDK
jgi:3-hydroxyisobutyrate dehydrogenase-like beta-hydroxyacid dehydrogenase